MNIAIIGTGGVGGFFGGRLAQLAAPGSGIDVSFLARGPHLEEIKKNGLTLDTDESLLSVRPTLATDDLSAIPAPDLCLVCVKGYDLAEVLVPLAEKIRETTVILPLLNGVDIPERIRSVTGAGIILPACVYIGTHIEMPGRIRQRGGSCTIHFGDDPGRGGPSPWLFDIFRRSGIKYSYAENPFIEIWSKFLFIASFGLLTALHDLPIGGILQSAELASLARSIMKEILSLAEKKGVPLPLSIADDSLAKAAAFPFDTRTSFQRDFADRNRKDERDLFGGSILRMGSELGIDVPVTRAVYAELQRIKPLP